MFSEIDLWMVEEGANTSLESKSSRLSLAGIYFVSGRDGTDFRNDNSLRFLRSEMLLLSICLKLLYLDVETSTKSGTQGLAMVSSKKRFDRRGTFALGRFITRPCSFSEYVQLQAPIIIGSPQSMSPQPRY